MTTLTNEPTGDHDAVLNTGEASYSFAQFWKCALQVNPQEYSKAFRGQDHGLEGDAFLEALRQQKYRY